MFCTHQELQRTIDIMGSPQNRSMVPWPISTTLPVQPVLCARHACVPNLGIGSTLSTTLPLPNLTPEQHIQELTTKIKDIATLTNITPQQRVCIDQLLFDLHQRNRDRDNMHTELSHKQQRVNDDIHKQQSVSNVRTTAKMHTSNSTVNRIQVRIRTPLLPRSSEKHHACIHTILMLTNLYTAQHAHGLIPAKGQEVWSKNSINQ